MTEKLPGSWSPDKKGHKKEEKEKTALDEAREATHSAEEKYKAAKKRERELWDGVKKKGTKTGENAVYTESYAHHPEYQEWARADKEARLAYDEWKNLQWKVLEPLIKEADVPNTRLKDGRMAHKRCLENFNDTISTGIDHGSCDDPRCAFFNIPEEVS